MAQRTAAEQIPHPLPFAKLRVGVRDDTVKKASILVYAINANSRIWYFGKD